MMNTMSKVWLFVLIGPFALMLPSIFFLDFFGIDRSIGSYYFAVVFMSYEALILLIIYVFNINLEDKQYQKQPIKEKENLNGTSVSPEGNQE